MIGYFLLFVLLIMSVSDVVKKDNSVLAYLIFFQEIHILIFKKIGLSQYSLIFYVGLVIIFSLFSYTSKTTEQRVKHFIFNPISISIIVICVMMIFHVSFYGFLSEESYILVNRFFLQIVPVLLFILVFVNSRASLIMLSNGIIKYGILFFSVVYFCTDLGEIADLSRSDFRDELGISPIQLSRLSGMIVIASVVYMYFKDFSVKYFKYILAFILGLYFMVLGMSRGPFISLLLTMFVVLYFSKKISLSSVFLVILFLAISIYLVIPFLSMDFSSRFEEFNDYESMLRFVRIQLFFSYLKEFEVFIFGLGPEGFGFKSGLKYPHNFAMELIIEYGLLGWLSLFLFIFYSFKFSKNILIFDFSPEALIFSSIFIYYFLASMVSANLIGNRALLFSSFILLNYFYNFKKYRYLNLEVK